MLPAQLAHGETCVTERTALLKLPQVEDTPQDSPDAIPTSAAPKLYLSHFLSTWNSRVFEFGAVLYLAAIFPGTLLPMSVYAFTRGLSAIFFASAVGQYIDTGNRLQVVRFSIVVQRLAVAASCVTFYILTIQLSLEHGVGTGIFVLLAFLACVEKLCSIMNLVAIEKDWVVVVTQKNEAALRSMNVQMRRIDFICKLLGPLFIALVDGFSTKVAIIVNLAMNIASVGIEYFAIARVYRDVPELQEPKKHSSGHQGHPRSSQESENLLRHDWSQIGAIITRSATDFNLYFHHRAFLPSIAGALTELTVLSFAGQMVTYLFSAGYSTTQIGIARTLSVVFELLTTWIAPWLMAKSGLVSAGLWLSRWQVITMVTGIVMFWASLDKPTFSATALVGATILSRIGSIGFYLCIQIIVQDNVEAESRGAFSSVEAAWQNAFQLLSYASTIIFSRPMQFKWPALISVVAIICANAAYTVYVHGSRGRLVHFGAVARLFATRKGKQREQERVIERIISNTDV